MGHSAPAFAANDGVLDMLVAAFGESVLDTRDEYNEIAITVRREAIVEVLTELRDTHEYQQLMEIAGVDYPDRPERFEVVYHLLSLTKNHRLRVRVTTDEVQPVPSVVGVWPNANWLEREVFDLYGVLFSGHPDLRRILTDYGFQGHPFRKDFPLTGYVEMRWSEEEKRVIYEPVELAQDFRSFDFMSPWEGAEYILPGDEKSSGVAPVATPKTTEKPADTGGGKAANAVAADKVSAGSPAVKGSDVATPAPDAQSRGVEGKGHDDKAPDDKGDA